MAALKPAPDRNTMLLKIGGKDSNKTLPLLVIIVVPFLVQVFAAVGLTGWLSFRNGQKAVNALSTQLRDEVANRIEQHLSSYLERPHEIIKANINATQLSQFNRLVGK